MNDLFGKGGTLNVVLEITRAATGETEVVELVGTIGEQPATAADVPAVNQGAEAQED